MTDEDLLTAEEAAAFLRVTKSALAQWRYLGIGPKYLKAGRKPLYQRGSLIEWLESTERQGTAKAAS